MKFLLFLAIALLVIWLWRSGRRSDSRSEQAAAPPPAPPGPQEMVRCAHCGVHLPHSDAVVGRIGLYCGTEHRQLAEK